MKTKLIYLVLLATFGCGSPHEDQSLLNIAPSLSGTDSLGRPCSFTYEKNTQGLLTQLSLKGTYLVDYKIPAPLSGIYGVQHWPGEFNMGVHTPNSPLAVKKNWLGNSEYVEGEGKPLFFDTPTHHHKITFEGGLGASKVVRYHATQKIGGVIPFITIDLECKL